MKGKYADAGERRRIMADLEQRATAAERERDRLTAQLAEISAKHEQETRALRNSVAEARGQRDSATSANLDSAHAATARLKGELERVRKERAQAIKTNKRMFRAIRSAAQAAGFRQHSAAASVVGLIDPEDYVTITRSEAQVAADFRAGQQYVNLHDQSVGYTPQTSDLADVLYRLYCALADSRWRRDGSAFIVDNWFTPQECAEDAPGTVEMPGESP